MAGYFAHWVIEWRYPEAETHHEEHGFIEWVGRSESEVREEFLKTNPEYEVIGIKMKTDKS